MLVSLRSGAKTSYASRTKNAIPKIRIEMANEPMKPTATTSWYVANTSHNKTTATVTLAASARKAVSRVPASELDLLREITIENDIPAQMLTKPPSIADTAP